jgi:predicted glutamine amidotransferase
MTLESGIIPMSASEAITRDLTESAFLATEIGRKAAPLMHNGSHRSYKLSKFNFDERERTAVLYLTDGLLDQTNLHLPANATSWSTLDPKKEEARTLALKASIELRLNRLLPADFAWGRLSVYFHPQNFSGSLVFSYACASREDS